MNWSYLCNPKNLSFFRFQCQLEAHRKEQGEIINWFLWSWEILLNLLVDWGAMAYFGIVMGKSQLPCFLFYVIDLSSSFRGIFLKVFDLWPGKLLTSRSETIIHFKVFILGLQTLLPAVSQLLVAFQKGLFRNDYSWAVMFHIVFSQDLNYFSSIISLRKSQK